MSNGSFHVPVEKAREKYRIFTLNFLIQNLTNISKMQKKASELESINNYQPGKLR